MKTSAKKERPTYKKPEVTDLGDLRELTATHQNLPYTDVPQGAPVQTSATP